MASNPKDRSSTPRRCALTAAPFVIGAVALYNWVISPHIGYLHAMQRLQPVMGQMAEQLDEISAGLDEKREKLRTLQTGMVEIRDGLFTPDEAKQYCRDLQALVEATGCTMISADFTRDGTEEPPGEDPNVPLIVETSHADLAVAGSYDQIVRLLQTFRERRQKVWLDSCDLNLVDPRHGRLECQFGLTLYAVLTSGELTQ